ncbi:MAG: oligoendopeptidase F, partial [Verrucomicrobia bacterium]|nr:oligoendopeptidase F [Verrucomicrobiota bacterium]
MIPSVSPPVPARKVPERSEVNPKDTWDLSPLYAKDADWEKGLEELRGQRGRMLKWKGKLHRGEDLAAALGEEREIDLMAERLGQYAHLRVAEDGGDGAARDRSLRLEHLTTQLAEETAWFLPELMSIGDAAWTDLAQHPRLAEWQGRLERVRRYRPHVLGEGEERLMALAGPALGGADEIFSQLTNVDFRFG